jgi:hypothetical protein
MRNNIQKNTAEKYSKSSVEFDSLNEFISKKGMKFLPLIEFLTEWDPVTIYKILDELCYWYTSMAIKGIEDQTGPIADAVNDQIFFLTNIKWKIYDTLNVDFFNID